MPIQCLIRKMEHIFIYLHPSIAITSESHCTQISWLLLGHGELDSNANCVQGANDPRGSQTKQSNACDAYP